MTRFKLPKQAAASMMTAGVSVYAARHAAPVLAEDGAEKSQPHAAGNDDRETMKPIHSIAKTTAPGRASPPAGDRRHISYGSIAIVQIWSMIPAIRKQEWEGRKR